MRVHRAFQAPLGELLASPARPDRMPPRRGRRRGTRSGHRHSSNVSQDGPPPHGSGRRARVQHGGGRARGPADGDHPAQRADRAPRPGAWHPDADTRRGARPDPRLRLARPPLRMTPLRVANTAPLHLASGPALARRRARASRPLLPARLVCRGATGPKRHHRRAGRDTERYQITVTRFSSAMRASGVTKGTPRATAVPAMRRSNGSRSVGSERASDT